MKILRWNNIENSNIMNNLELLLKFVTKTVFRFNFNVYTWYYFLKPKSKSIRNLCLLYYYILFFLLFIFSTAACKKKYNFLNRWLIINGNWDSNFNRSHDLKRINTMYLVLNEISPLASKHWNYILSPLVKCNILVLKILKQDL